jgi:type II secretion system protein G
VTRDLCPYDLVNIMNKAFTLIELLIVLVIIGIVAILAIPQYNQYVSKAQGAEAKTVLRSLADSLWRYHVETGSWPTTEEGFSKLDKKVPVSRYFDFSYTQGLIEDCQISATMKNKFLQLPVTRRMYTILYTKTPPPASGNTWNKVGEDYYVNYMHKEQREELERTYKYIYDWDGNLIMSAAVQI